MSGEMGGVSPEEVARSVIESEDPVGAFRSSGIKSRPVQSHEFQGRSDELSQVEKFLEADKSIFIHAEPRSGKTSLLTKLASDLPGGIFVDASRYSGDDEENVRLRMRKDLSKKILEEGESRVFLIDEADSAFRNPSFMSVLESSLNEGDKLVFAGVSNETVPEEIKINHPQLPDVYENVELSSYYPRELWESIGK